MPREGLGSAGCTQSCAAGLIYESA